MGKSKGKIHHSERQLAFLFASGILSRGGSGGGGGRRGKVTYHQDRAKAIQGISKVTGGKGTSTFRRKTGQAANMSHNHNSNAANSNPYGNGRHVIGGKTAGLRGGGGGKGRAIRDDLRSPSLGHNGTSLKNAFGLIAKKHGVDVKDVRREAQGLAKSEKLFGSSKGGKYASGITHGGQDAVSAPRAFRQQRLRTRLETEGKTNMNSKAMRNLTRAERIAASRTQAQAFFSTPKGQKLKQERIAAGSADSFKAQRRAAGQATRGGSGSGGGGSKPKADYSATRAARIAEGKKVAHEQLDRLRTVTSGSRRQSVTNLRNYRQNPTFTAHLLTDNKSDTLSPKRLKRIYSSVAVAARSTNARSVLKRNWPKK